MSAYGAGHFIPLLHSDCFTRRKAAAAASRSPTVIAPSNNADILRKRSRNCCSVMGTGSDAELLEVVVEVAVHQRAPILGRKHPEDGVGLELLGLSARNKTLDSGL